jgi:hypothetical protein
MYDGLLIFFNVSAALMSASVMEQTRLSRLRLLFYQASALGRINDAVGNNGACMLRRPG